ncbi:MAG: hypothetical protein NTW72_05825, partial [Gemmatimonadetes bacterium]|nr:hypothetical protein [Gemmatimonadota bacterium]
MNRITCAIGLALLAVSSTVQAQGRGMLFSLSTRDAPAGSAFAMLDAAVSERSFEPVATGRVEQGISGQIALPHQLVLAARAGVATGSAARRGSGQFEIWREVGPSGRALSLFGGLGARREYGGTSLVTARFGASRMTRGDRVLGNVLLERALGASDRDAIDVITSIGWLHRTGSWGEVGFEAVGQDLEGFWTPDEAEGGARLMVGPTVAFAPTR